MHHSVIHKSIQPENKAEEHVTNSYDSYWRRNQKQPTLTLREQGRVPTDRSLQLHEVVSVIQNVLGVGGALLHVVHLHAHPITGQGLHEWPVKPRAKQLKLPVRWPNKTTAGQTTGQTAQTTRQVAHQNHGGSYHGPNSSKYPSGGPSKPPVKEPIQSSINHPSIANQTTH